MPPLFVYGTLQRGQRNHRLLADQRFVGPAATGPGYRLFDLGAYPGLVRDGRGSGVRGELFEVSECCLDELDDFEGVPDLFTREEVGLAGGGWAWVYLYNRPVPAGAAGGEEWPIG